MITKREIDSTEYEVVGPSERYGIITPCLHVRVTVDLGDRKATYDNHHMPKADLDLIRAIKAIRHKISEEELDALLNGIDGFEEEVSESTRFDGSYEG